MHSSSQKIYPLCDIFMLVWLIMILFTYPLLTYPYDIYAHLIAIYETGNNIKNSTSIPESRLLWHTIWSELFTILQITDDKIFLRAKIIHLTQTYLAFFTIYYFSHVILRNIFKNINTHILRSLAYWSSIIWFIIFASSVASNHQIWNQFYSVNYQITLPLFWYITALTLVLFWEETSIQKRMIFIMQIILISLFILRVHPMEFMYYLMYISILVLVFLDKVFCLFKKYYYFFVSTIILLVYLIGNFQTESSKIFTYLAPDKLPYFYDAIMNNGKQAVSYFNRSSASINELMYVIASISFFTLFFMLWHTFTKKEQINIRPYLFVLFTASFLLIPLYEFSSGLFSIIARKDVIHRLYYSSSIFILLPASIYYFSQQFHFKSRYIHLTIFLILLGTAIYSKHSPYASHNYYRNIHSIGESFDAKKYAFNLSKKQIQHIGNILTFEEEKNLSSQKNYYYARADIAFVIKYIYHKKVYWEGRRKNPDYLKHYHTDMIPANYRKVLFETPKTFPRYRPYL